MPNYLTNALAEGRPGELLNKITDAYRACDQQLVSLMASVFHGHCSECNDVM
jgi:hypothetical protein